MMAARQFALLTVACTACTGTTLDVGTNDAGPTRRAAEAGPDAAPGGSGLEALLGTWTGYIESYSFSSGSDGVVLAFTQDASGEVEGAVTLGQGEPPPPATDGNIGYPPALEDAGLFASDLLANGGLYEGFPYTVVAMSFDGIRLTAGVALTELWKSWCPLQTSYGDEADGGGAP